MGKIRIKTIGDKEAEKKQQDEAKKRSEAKKAEKAQEAVPAETNKTEKADSAETVKKIKHKPAKTETEIHKRSRKYLAVSAKVNKDKLYELNEALKLLPELKITDFDETVELHINTIDKGLSGSVVLPHGSGKKVRITIINQSENPKGVEELVKKVEAGIIDFDILLATPDSMPKLARIARYLGPRGLMPNPKSGTVTTKPQDMVKKYEGGQVNFKTESKFPLLHIAVGKLSFGANKLSENIAAVINAVQLKNIKDITLKSTMSPGLKIDTNRFK